jgi:hypothetical protein
MVKFDPSTEALCLDGTPAGVFFVKGHGTGLNKTVLIFDGGGWCDGRTRNDMLDDCFKRATTDDWLGSSKNWPDSVYAAYWTGDLSDDSVYWNWNRIYVKYCDGTGH